MFLPERAQTTYVVGEERIRQVEVRKGDKGGSAEAARCHVHHSGRHTFTVAVALVIGEHCAVVHYSHAAHVLVAVDAVQHCVLCVVKRYRSGRLDCVICIYKQIVKNLTNWLPNYTSLLYTRDLFS